MTQALASGRADVNLSGRLTEWEIAGDSGKAKRPAFCPTCGTPVCQTYPAAPDLITIAVGSLDDPGRYRPQAVTYASRAHDWDRVDPALVKFDTMPPGS